MGFSKSHSLDLFTLSPNSIQTLKILPAFLFLSFPGEEKFMKVNGKAALLV